MPEDNMGPGPQDEARVEVEDAESTPAPEGEVETLRAKLAEAEANLVKARDAQLRERAEIENQRRRMQRELEQSRRFANKKLLEDLLPVCDNLERGLAADHPDAASLGEGMKLTLRSLLKVMEDSGLEQINPLGEPFDPEYHEAMQMVEPGEGQQPNTVVMVVEKGYVLNERLLRPARVIVAREA